MRPTLRRGGLVAFTGCAVVASAGCTVTSTSSNCSGLTCEVTLSGEGASTELGAAETPIKLVAIEDGQATIELGDAQGSCSAGETIELAESSVECTNVDDDSVQLTVTG